MRIGKFSCGHELEADTKSNQRMKSESMATS